jgi:hypothetical protein
MTTYTITLISNTNDATNVYLGIRIVTDDAAIIALGSNEFAFNLNDVLEGFLGGSADGDFTVSTPIWSSIGGGLSQTDVILTVPQTIAIPAIYADLPAFHAANLILSLDNATEFNDITFNPACFQKGTNILTPDGYTLIELLKKDDLVVSAHSGKNVPIKAMLRFFGTQENCPLYCLPKESLGENKPIHDLFLSSRHRVLYEGKLRHMVCLAEQGKCVPVEKAQIEYYHIELVDCFDTVIAEGLEVETYIDSRIVRHDWECTNEGCTYIPIGTQPTTATPEAEMILSA